MKNTLLATGLVVCIFTTGCVVSVGGGSRRPTKTHKPHDRTPCTGREDQSATMAEIDAVNRLISDTHKRDRLNSIANRKCLAPATQVHLINSVFKLISESSKVDVLLTLIKNPCFSCKAKIVIIEKLHGLISESHKMKILDAMDKRNGCVDEAKQIIIETKPTECV